MKNGMNVAVLTVNCYAFLIRIGIFTGYASD